MNQIDVRTKAFGCIMFPLEKKNEQNTNSQRTTTNQERTIPE